MADISSMDDIQGLFQEAIAEFMENGLGTELDDELGYSRDDYKNLEKTRVKKSGRRYEMA